MKKPLCIYHGNCFDGFTAAWCVRKALGDRVDFHEGNYGQPPPDVTGRDVIIVDFSYKRPVLLEMQRTADSILILDHHKTAAEDLDGFNTPPSSFDVWQHVIDGKLSTSLRIAALFDMERSGAGLAWDYFVGGPRISLVAHVEDRDLWRFKLAGTREIHAAMSAHPFDFTAWDEMAEKGTDVLWREGAGILRKHDIDVRKLVELTQRTMIIGGYAVPVGNVAPQWVSDACNLMAQGERFAAAYYDGVDGRYFSLRSTDAGLDVSAIAKGYGGGGHRNAAGFKMPRGWEGDLTPSRGPTDAFDGGRLG